MANSISRLEKLEKLDDPYPRDFPGRETISSILFQYNNNVHLKDRLLSNLNPSKPSYKIAGRISARRGHKENIFLNIFDQTGQIQLHAKNPVSEIRNRQKELKNITGFGGSIIDPNPSFWNTVEECDIGDMVGVEGTIGQNPRGEPLLAISNFITLAKALKDPPANFHGVKNPEHKYRHREQDLLSSAETRELFKTRAQIVFEIRKYLNERDFVEIECPVLQPIYGGATARPFKTSHNALGQDFFLSISSELYLKRAMVGGFDRVYSFSRCFRNEGISPEHNPEFTNLEIFESCKTAHDMSLFTLDILKYLYNKFADKGILESYSFVLNQLSVDWPLSRKISIPMQPDNVHKNPNEYADAWELEIDGMEIASGASDLNDPREQEARLKESEEKAIDNFSKQKDLNPEYDPYDQNYIEALEMGALPWAGVGIGVDRLVMLLTEKTNIRDCIMFPTLRQLPADE